MICIVTYVIGCYFSYTHTHMLFFCRQSKSHGLLVAIVCVIIGLRTHLWLWTCLSHITHIFFSWTISIVLPNHTQFILVNCMPYIAHTLIWWSISVVLAIANSSYGLTVCHASHTQLWSESCLMSVPSQIVRIIFYGFLTPPFAINASHTVSSNGLWLYCHVRTILQ